MSKTDEDHRDEEYRVYVDKIVRKICPVCDKPYSEHVYPEKIPCPDCGKLDRVHIWEAWGHPNGQLECQRCHGPMSRRKLPYHTFYKGEDGQTVIVPWHTVEQNAE